MIKALKIHIDAGDVSKLLFQCGTSESLLGPEDGALMVVLEHLHKKTKEGLILSLLSVFWRHKRDKWRNDYKALLQSNKHW